MSRRLTPEQVRVRSHADTSAYPAIAELRALLTAGAESEAGFWAWLAEPFTQRMTRALEELADNPPPYPADTKESLLVQYGITTGLQLAAKLLTNPRRVYPEVFRDPKSDVGDEPLGSYTENADRVIDSM